MEASSNIRKVLSDKKISVPTYQRAYSWDSPIKDSTRKSQVREFYNDIVEHSRSKTTSQYYLGHFLFEETDDEFFIIDGQQRLTTTTIFLAVIFDKLRLVRDLTEDEIEQYEDLIKRGRKIRFSTVYYDNILFADYVINKEKRDDSNLETESAKRIVAAYKYFESKLSNKEECFLLQMLKIVSEASCTTHIVRNPSEAMQMFIFQNNRGKRPSNLEIVKAQFMYIIHLHGADDTKGLVKTVQDRFENIYKSISYIENNVTEDDVLGHTLKVYYNSLWEDNSLDKINKELAANNPIEFIEKFSIELMMSFESLRSFFNCEKTDINIHSLLRLKSISIAYPFIIKAYKNNASVESKTQLFTCLEKLIFRHQTIGTKADIRSRIKDIFVNFDGCNCDALKERLQYLKIEESYWWGHWNNNALHYNCQYNVHKDIAKYILWKYENHLESLGKSGYKARRYDSIDFPELEHIAPKTKPDVPSHGYGKYTEKFIRESIESIGNYLLISKSHNCSVGNKIFSDKLSSYSHLKQQMEIHKFIGENKKWDSNAISKRKDVLLNFIMNNL